MFMLPWSLVTAVPCLCYCIQPQLTLSPLSVSKFVHYASALNKSSLDLNIQHRRFYNTVELRPSVAFTLSIFLYECPDFTVFIEEDESPCSQRACYDTAHHTLDRGTAFIMRHSIR